MLLALIGSLAVFPGRAQADDLTRAARELQAKYAAQLKELAAWCDQQGLKEQAQKTRAWLGVRDPNKLYVTEFPREIGRPELPEGAPAGVVEWDSRFMLLRKQYANALEALARRAVRADRASLAFELALAAVRENPDHKTFRRMLGFQEFHGGWYTLYEIDRMRAGQIWHDKYGWILKNHVRRYEEGQRFVKNAWISAEDDARQHRDIENGWDIETEHYSIRTNHSLEAGVALGEKLERLYVVWRQLFFRYFASDAQVRELFDGKIRNRRPTLPRFKVVYFRTREDYNRSLKGAFPNIEISIGVYVESTRRAYFFAGDDSDERTLYHEATHQLFHESRQVAMEVGARSNFWVIEGIAMYMESLHQEDGFYVLGGFDDARMKAARHRLLVDKFYIPLSEFCAMGMGRIQNDPRIATLYSQAAGLTHFLIHYDNGRYRDALVSYLSQIYSGRDNALLLPQLVGTSSVDLDAQYREFMVQGGQPAPKKEKPPAEKTGPLKLD